MSPIKWLNKLLFLENLLGIYRNYCIQNKIKKRWIVFQVVAQNVVHTTIVIGEAQILLKGQDLTKIINIAAFFSTLTFLNSASSVFTGICYSRDFMSYLGSITHLSKCFKDDQLKRSLKKTYWFSIAFTILAIVFCVYRSAWILIKYVQNEGDTNILIFVSIFVSQAFVRITIVCEKIIFFFVIMLVVHLTKCLNSMVSAVQESLGSCDISLDEHCNITQEQIQEWVVLHRQVANCCEKLTLCFGQQFLFSLILSMTYYMLLTNDLCNKNVTNKGETRTVFIVLNFVAITMLPIYAGQLIRNQGMKFHIILARLYKTMIIIDSKEAEAKLIKDFVRLIKQNPIQIKLLSNIPAGMYTLPVILSLAVNYVIVILQFNNVI